MCFNNMLPESRSKKPIFGHSVGSAQLDRPTGNSSLRMSSFVVVFSACNCQERGVGVVFPWLGTGHMQRRIEAGVSMNPCRKIIADKGHLRTVFAHSRPG